MAVRKDEFSDENRRAGKAKKRGRLAIDMDDETRRKIKIIAARKDISVTQYVNNALKQIVAHEIIEEEPVRRPISQEAIERLLRYREEFIRETKGELFDDSTELIRQMREERTKYLMGEE